MNCFLWILLITLALAAQNPLAVNSDPFSGTFQNDRLKLDLTRATTDYSGTILMNGQSFPVKAKAAAGKLEGTFESQEQTYTFQATRTGSQLTLTTDGATHTLEKVVVTPVIGEWQSPSGIVRVNADGSAIIGDKPHRWILERNVITFAGVGGESIKVPFELAGNTWTWKFPQGQLVLTRLTVTNKGIVGSWQGPTGNVQLNLDGSATVGGVIYRYALAENQLTLNGADGTFVATVRQSGDTMSWVVNGKTLTFQRAAEMWAIGGAGAILPELVGKWCEVSNGACYSFLADGSFQYGSGDSGRWTAGTDSITATSKKTGVRTIRMAKRNHPKTGDPMLVLDGAEYTTAFRRAPWP